MNIAPRRVPVSRSGCTDTGKCSIRHLSRASDRRCRYRADGPVPLGASILKETPTFPLGFETLEVELRDHKVLLRSAAMTNDIPARVGAAGRAPRPFATDIDCGIISRAREGRLLKIPPIPAVACIVPAVGRKMHFPAPNDANLIGAEHADSACSDRRRRPRSVTGGHVHML